MAHRVHVLVDDETLRRIDERKGLATRSAFVRASLADALARAGQESSSPASGDRRTDAPEPPVRRSHPTSGGTTSSPPTASPRLNVQRSADVRRR
jgi:hypothetical protein